MLVEKIGGFQDYQTEKMNGLQLRDLIRKGNREIPIILMTGESDHKLRVGFDGFLQKPFTMSELCSEVDRVRSSICD
jgi:CheY-like chemotaxis protein